MKIINLLSHKIEMCLKIRQYMNETEDSDDENEDSDDENEDNDDENEGNDDE